MCNYRMQSEREKILDLDGVLSFMYLSVCVCVVLFSRLSLLKDPPSGRSCHVYGSRN